MAKLKNYLVLQKGKNEPIIKGKDFDYIKEKYKLIGEADTIREAHEIRTKKK